VFCEFVFYVSTVLCNRYRFCESTKLKIQMVTKLKAVYFINVLT